MALRSLTQRRARMGEEWSTRARARKRAQRADVSSRTKRSDAEGVAGVLDVVLQLGDERVDAVELALAAQEVREADLRPLAVQVALEVEQVGFEQRVVGVLVEGGTAAEVDGARQHLTVRAFVPAGVHPVGGEAHR